MFTTDNGTENFTWPDGGNTPFAAGKGTIMEGGMRVPMIARWPGHIPAGKVENGIMSGLDFFPTLVAAAGDPNIKDELLKGKQLGDTTYKVHLDGYDQLDVLTGKGPSNRHEIFYFAEGTLGAVRIDDWKYQDDRPARRMARTERSSSIGRSSPISGSIRSSGCSSRRAIPARSTYVDGLLRPRVLALRLPAAEGRRIRADLRRLPADAAGGELQSRSGQGPNRRADRGDERQDGVAEPSTRDAQQPGTRTEHHGRAVGFMRAVRLSLF